MSSLSIDLMEYAKNTDAQEMYVSNDTTESIAFNFESGGDASHSIGNNGGDQYWSAGKITITSDISCSAVSIYLESVIGTPSGDMTFRLETDNNGPSGTLVNSNSTGTIANASISAPAWNKCTFSSPFHLPPGEYWLVVYIPTQSVSGTRWNWTRDNNGVGGGGYSINGGVSWEAYDNTWMPYIRLYEQVLQSFSESTVKTEGLFSLKGIANTSALNKTLTKQTSITLIDEGVNPIFPAGQIGETSIITDGNSLDCWYAGGMFVDLYHTSASDSICASFGTATGPLLEDIRFPYVFLNDGTYYMFAHRVGYSGIYLWSSTDKTTWTIMNSGNPVLTSAGGDEFRFTYNVGVCVVNDIWHMFIESGYEVDQSDVALRYTYSTLAELNFDTHKSNIAVIPGGGNPHPVYLADKKSFLMLYGKLSSTTGYWDIKAATASSDNNIGDPNSWSEGNFIITYPNMHTVDPTIAQLSSAKDHKIALQFFYNQQYIYQLYSDLTLNNFHDSIGGPINLSNINYLTFDLRSSRIGQNIKISLHNDNGALTEITPNITEANVFQKTVFDISQVANEDKDSIDSIIITIVNADEDNIFYLDNFKQDAANGSFFLFL